MSGTSLDGVDLAYCTFEEHGDHFSFSIGACDTIPYDVDWLKRLKTLPQATAVEYAETHVAYGRHIGELVKEFILHYKLETDFVSSHGHTIFHHPGKLYTSQIGEGAAIAGASGLLTVCDFRTGDVAAGGQGAPLVPIGDEMLFGEYDYCLNLGGFANISMRKQGARVAFDISPANIILNYLSEKRGNSFDRDGAMAASGRIHNEFLNTLNDLGYYHQPPPKSLGREWVEMKIHPLLTHYNISPEDAACTFCEHIAFQISQCIVNQPDKQILITGGGAFNSFLISRLTKHTAAKIIIPDPQIVNYKEALVFAFLGLLRIQQKTNCLASVTGAKRNVSGGAIYLP